MEALGSDRQAGKQARQPDRQMAKANIRYGRHTGSSTLHRTGPSAALGSPLVVVTFELTPAAAQGERALSPQTYVGNEDSTGGGGRCGRQGGTQQEASENATQKTNKHKKKRWLHANSFRTDERTEKVYTFFRGKKTFYYIIMQLSFDMHFD